MDDTMPPPAALDGITLYHTFGTSDEGVRMWHVAGVGTGKMLQWAAVEKLFKSGMPAVPDVRVTEFPPPVLLPVAGDINTRMPMREEDPKKHQSATNWKRGQELVIQKRQQSEHKAEARFREANESLVPGRSTNGMQSTTVSTARNHY